MADDILGDSQDERIENLPVAAGKRRRGRPRKVRIADAVENAVVTAPANPQSQENGVSPPSSASDLRKIVRDAVEGVVKARKPASPHSKKGVLGVLKQVARSEVRKLVTRELQNAKSDVGAASQSEIRDVVADEVTRDVLSTDHGQSHPFWHLLMNR